MPSASGAPLLFVPFTRLGSLPAGPLRVLDLRLRRQVTAPARPPCAPVLSAYAGTASGLGGPGICYLSGGSVALKWHMCLEASLQSSPGCSYEQWLFVFLLLLPLR